MERTTFGRRLFKKTLLGGLVGLLLGGSIIAAPAASAAAAAAPVPVSIAAQQEFVVGFYGTGGKIVDLHQLYGEGFEQVVLRNTGARWEFGYDGQFRFVAADGSPTMAGFWDVRRNQGVLPFEASAVVPVEGGRLEVAMRGQINPEDGTARVEQARQLIRGGEVLQSYTEFTIALH